MARNCEACPVNKSQGKACDSIPNSPNTCLKRVNRTVSPPMKEEEFFKIVGNGVREGGKKVSFEREIQFPDMHELRRLVKNPESLPEGIIIEPVYDLKNLPAGYVVEIEGERRFYDIYVNQPG